MALDNNNEGANADRRRLVAWMLASGASAPLLADIRMAAAQDGGDSEELHNALLWAVAWKQTAAEFGALCHQAYNLARLRVDMALATRKPGDKPLAVITDMDDTIIHAGSYWGHLINNGREFFDDGIWDRWLPENRITAVPGATDFLDYCRDNAVEVFYVTSRNQGEKTYDYALDQLRFLDLPYADREHLTVYRESSDKTPSRDLLSDSWNIVLLLGDNLNDYKRDYYVADVDERYALMERDRKDYGDRFILLPNPTDGHWVRAIFGDSEPAETDANRQKLKQAATRRAWPGA